MNNQNFTVKSDNNSTEQGFSKCNVREIISSFVILLLPLYIGFVFGSISFL